MVIRDTDSYRYIQLSEKSKKIKEDEEELTLIEAWDLVRVLCV